LANPEAELLKKFELVPGTDFHVFGGQCVCAASEIEANYRKSSYDHRPFLPKDLELGSPFWTEQYRVGYACFKREVARVVKPQKILEIGIGIGIGGLAMMHGFPSAFYYGIDNDTAEFSVKPSAFVEEQMKLRGHTFAIEVADSQKMQRFPECDLVHVDGDHRREAARHDVTLAWQCGAKWILCDDARDSEVCCGIFDALNLDLNRGSVEWAYFGDTWTGSILIRTDHS
jgi:methyltransferase family protein